MARPIRVHELAKELGVSSKEILRVLKEQMNIEFQTHMALVNDQVARKVRYLIKGEEGEAAKDRGVTQAPSPGLETEDEEALDLLEDEEALTREKIRRARRGDEGRKRVLSRGPKLAEKEKKEWPVPKEVEIKGPLTVGELASLLRLPAGEVIKKLLLSLGITATVTQTLDPDTAALLAEEFGSQARLAGKAEEPSDEELLRRLEEDPSSLLPRPPVVTVMGHVDHGKTTLLDAIRETRVAESEAGGITQHIGASVVERGGRKMVFLDTPGHEAFTAMRARGAQVTDIVVLVVAADDGVMPQTVEALNHARAAGVPIIVAINKIDKPEANPDRVKQQLAEQGLVPEEWGGDTMFVPVSALRKQGIEELLDAINLLAELHEFRANPHRPAVGTIIEARMDRGLGPVATVLVRAGTLKVGEPFVAGLSAGKVRAMRDDRGRQVREAPPATPVEVLGFDSLPEAGDVFRVVASEKVAREMVEARREKRRAEEAASRPGISVADLYRRMQEAREKELKVILKADVRGSLEAIGAALSAMEHEGIRVRVIHGGVGPVSESDVALAAATDGLVLGFNVKLEPRAREAAREHRVEIRLHRIIYELLDDVKRILAGMSEPRYQEVLVGLAEVRALFRVPGVGQVAGLYVREGKITRSSRVRVVREGREVARAPVASLKRFKEDVREVGQGYECGLALEGFSDFQVGDTVEAYVLQEVP